MWIECRRLPDGGVIMFDISINDKKVSILYFIDRSCENQHNIYWRWREVKLRALSDADHMTLRDLKG
ncbi:hypothetical protein DEO72_LG2g8 [Vigna unguiculata]|uniref:Uncharacterized protein n=1 Tax=Vigna unguiculata TaxID=3917 RepID=A0A4D6KZN3_VIGUN|nr:hypothetical protein DEO72_LG2g8 [Vigna unguiculata]